MSSSPFGAPTGGSNTFSTPSSGSSSSNSPWGQGMWATMQQPSYSSGAPNYGSWMFNGSIGPQGANGQQNPSTPAAQAPVAANPSTATQAPAASQSPLPDWEQQLGYNMLMGTPSQGTPNTAWNPLQGMQPTAPTGTVVNPFASPSMGGLGALWGR